MATCACAFGDVRTVMVSTTGAILYPPNFAAANNLLTPATALPLIATASPVLSVNGMTGHITIDTELPPTASFSVLTVSTLSAGHASVSSFFCDLNASVEGALQAGGLVVLNSTIPETTISSGNIITEGTVSAAAVHADSVQTGELTYTTQRYAVFEIPICAEYTEFILKGYTQTGNSVSVVFEFCSWDFDVGDFNPYQQWSVRPDVFFLDPDNDADGRLWRALNPSAGSISELLSAEHAVGGAVIVVKEPATATWFSEGNPRLLWAYCLASEYEGLKKTNQGNFYWVPILPKWTSTLINP